MGNETTEEQEFYIQTVGESKAKVVAEGERFEFVKVEAELVELSEGIRGFAYNSAKKGEPVEVWHVFDLESGWVLCKPFGTKIEALTKVKEQIEEEGVARYREKQKAKIDMYGRSPAVKDDDIEVIREPTQEREIKTCVRE